MDHTPPIQADDESGQHLYDLPQALADIKNRVALVAAFQDDVVPNDRFRRNSVAFLARHPNCRITIFDEYDCEHRPEDPTT